MELLIGIGVGHDTAFRGKFSELDIIDRIKHNEPFIITLN
jgi:hypothetical protein